MNQDFLLPPYYRSPLFISDQQAEQKIVHGFFGRQGGVSAVPYDSLNCGLQKGDAKEAVLENRRRMALALVEAGMEVQASMEVEAGMEVQAGLEADSSVPLLFVKQQHTNRATCADPTLSEPCIADALVTDQSNILIGVQTADCTPVLFCDPIANIVGAAHAGWRGFGLGILENTIALMEQKGAKREAIQAAIGPCIWQASFEVGEDVRAIFSKFSDLFLPWTQTPQQKQRTYAFDLPAAVMRVLRQEGIKDISGSPSDTYVNAREYFSFRRSTHQGMTQFGCQASIIGLLTEERA